DLHAIIEAQKAVGVNYMMMETAVYSREFFMIQELYNKGVFGKISFARGSHLQDMEGYPRYWQGFPPHHYMTHAISPILKLLGTRVEKTYCLGSGQLSPERKQVHGNPFPIETALFRLEDSDVAVEITRSLFHMARSYTESFSIYGDNLGFEWPQIEGESPIMFVPTDSPAVRGRRFSHQTIAAPDRHDLLPPELFQWTRRHERKWNGTTTSQGGGHGGSHPHLVHEFIRSIVEGRASAIDAITSANWTAPDIAAHQSAMAGGDPVVVPRFS
ncbi:gfo/Idh/MocA family oxidoreductase, partial [Mesorhizobium sp. BHbdii]